MPQRVFYIIVLIFFLGCTKETRVAEDDSLTSARVSIVVSQDTETRAAWIYDQYFPSAEVSYDERKHFNCILLVFHQDMLLYDYATYDWAGNDGKWIVNDNPANEIFSFVLGIAGTERALVKTGINYFYYIANFPPDLYQQYAAMGDLTGSMTKDEFEERTLGSKPGMRLIDRITNREAYNLAGYMMTNIAPPVAQYLVANYSSPANYPDLNNVTMHPGRAYAKVSVAYLPSVEENGSLSDVRFQIMNDPKTMFASPNFMNGEVLTPHYDDTAIDNFDYTSQRYKDLFFSLEERNYSLEDDDPDNVDRWRKATTTAVTDPDLMEFIYCVENNNRIPTQGNSTYALIRGVFTPDNWLNSNGQSGDPSSDGTFWRLRNSNGTYATGYYNNVPTPGPGQEAVEYMQGITYYPVWLKTKDKYMVRRNGFYKIAVTELFNAGAPDLRSVIVPEQPFTASRAADYSNQIGILCVQDDI